MKQIVKQYKQNKKYQNNLSTEAKKEILNEEKQYAESLLKYI